MKLRIGSRGSILAKWQADWVAGALCELDVETEWVHIKTSGDIVQEGPISGIGPQGVFTKEIQNALLKNDIDIAVHSLKDLPTDPVDGLRIAAVPQRAPAFDAFVSQKFASLESLPENSIIGTGSIRRRTQILNRFGRKHRILDIRGNVETRLKKLDSGEFDAIILAEAGLFRLGLSGRIRETLKPPFFLPAVGQGALGIEIRANDEKAAKSLAGINDQDTFDAVEAERAFLLKMQGGCSAPIAAYAHIENGILKLHGRVLSTDGVEMSEKTIDGPPDDARILGANLAIELLGDFAQGLRQ